MAFDELVKYIEKYLILEQEFILNSDTSSLDLLPHEQTDRFKNFNWHYADYPGKPFGPNEKLASNMISSLNKLRPERRANTGSTAVVTESKYKALAGYIDSELRAVPDFAPGSGFVQARPGHFKLNQYALNDFLVMRAAALRDGVPL